MRVTLEGPNKNYGIDIPDSRADLIGEWLKAIFDDMTTPKPVRARVSFVLYIYP